MPLLTDKFGKALRSFFNIERHLRSSGPITARVIWLQGRQATTLTVLSLGDHGNWSVNWDHYRRVGAAGVVPWCAAFVEANRAAETGVVGAGGEGECGEKKQDSE
jgi:hypothetical protein